jgi:hypothetical protein
MRAWQSHKPARPPAHGSIKRGAAATQEGNSGPPIMYATAVDTAATLASAASVRPESRKGKRGILSAGAERACPCMRRFASKRN